MTIDWLVDGNPKSCPFFIYEHPFKMRVNGSDFKDVGNHTFRVTITDTHNSTFEFFKIEIYNTPPVFVPTDEVPTGKI